jgi:hypothetical protein
MQIEIEDIDGNINRRIVQLLGARQFPEKEHHAIDACFDLAHEVIGRLPAEDVHHLAVQVLTDRIYELYCVRGSEAMRLGAK